jgi:hypothetical protein
MIDLVTVRSTAVHALDPTDFDPSRGTQTRAKPEPKRPARTIAQRKSSLEGGVLALVDNRAGTQLAAALEPRLKDHFKLAEVLWVKKDTVNVPPRAGDWAEIKARATAGLALYGA